LEKPHERRKEAIRADDEVVSKAEFRALQQQVKWVQQVLGKNTLKNESLREAGKVAYEKPMSRLPLLQDGALPRRR
jgi:transposase